MRKITVYLWRLAVLLGLVACVAAGYWYYLRAHTTLPTYQTSAEAADVYVRFDMEAYDAIVKNYWVKPGDYAQFNIPELPDLFRLAVNKATGGTATLATSTRDATAAMLATAFKNATSTDAERTDALQTLSIVLYNLAPAGRDQLLSKAEETALRQDVANVNPASDLYGNLGLQKGASNAAIQTAYQQKAAALAHATTSAAQAEKAQLAYAYDVLSSSVGKTLYDQTGAEPSVFSHIYGSTLYLEFDKISPTTLQEFAYAVDAASTTPLSGLILDMRGNVGGDLAFAQAFLGLWLGGNQYAFDLYAQGNTEPERTTQAQFSELSRFTDVAVLTDDQTQSTAELTTASLKRFKLATVVGTKTRGWGSVENTYPLSTVIDPKASYALLLVNHLTLRDDELPIEQNGVVPNVDTTTSGWQKELPQYFHSAAFIKTLEERLAAPPVK
ncbi:MAG: hypothetical protein KGI73_03690 [Patescibacteria group bacterium]|nr:hypothetical protein [Patescibacteria group bacterium]